MQNMLNEHYVGLIFRCQGGSWAFGGNESNFFR